MLKNIKYLKEFLTLSNIKQHIKTTLTKSKF